MPDLFHRQNVRELVLRDYQLAAIESARENIRAGKRRQILCAPTGAGKTIIALGLMKAASDVAARSAFLVDRSALVDQTSQALDLYGIDHGVMQADHWRSRPKAYVQLVSAQTLGRRLGKGGYVESVLRGLRFVLIDECFPEGTLIDTPNGRRPIEAVSPGDKVITAIGPCRVRSVFKGTATRLINMRLSNGTEIRCTTDHPIFTTSGWTEARFVGVGASLFSVEDVRALWRDDAALRIPSLSEMGDGAHLQQASILREVLRAEIGEPDARSDGAREIEGIAQTHWTPTNSAWREWAAAAASPVDVAQIAGAGMASRIRGQDGGEAWGGTGLLLQDRRREPEVAGSRRDRWRQSRKFGAERTGREERCLPQTVRVESVEVEECGRDVPVFNLRIGEGHPSYFAGGVLVHNCHTQYQSTLDWLDTLPESCAVIGLTATPFTKGLGRHYQAIVNVATTDGLIAAGNLTKPILYAAVEADVSGVAVKSTGEWDEKGLETAGVKIIGDVVAEYIKRTTEHFDGPAKTICFSSTVAHGEEICRAFAGIGLNFQNISYRDDDDERKAKIAEFRKPDSSIMGLVSCDALAKGFDVPDVKVCILCRPLRKSLTTHIQQIGRVMRPAPGKDKAVVLDHTGNSLRFLADTVDFWASGVDELDDRAEKDRTARTITEKERKELLCLGCQAIMPASATCCPACGRERPRKPSNVVTINGSTHRLDLQNPSGRRFDFAKHPLLCHPDVAYRSFLAFATHRKRGDEAAGRRWAAGLFKGVYGTWPPRTFDALAHDPAYLTFEVESFCKKEMARYARSRNAA